MRPDADSRHGAADITDAEPTTPHVDLSRPTASPHIYIARRPRGGPPFPHPENATAEPVYTEMAHDTHLGREKEVPNLGRLVREERHAAQRPWFRGFSTVHLSVT